ncbi:MAG: glycosyltransferase family 4 protein [Castellaniella sp.]
MRILMLNTERGWRGGERQTLLSLTGMARAGHEVCLLAREGGALAQAAREAGVQTVEFASMPALCRALWQRRAAFDIMHAQTAAAMTALALLRPFLRARTVFTRRTAFAVNRRLRLTAWKWRRADVFLAISAAAAQGPRSLGLTVHAIIPSAVPFLPVNEHELETLRERIPFTGRTIIATVAALTPEKDPLTLVRAMDVLRRQHPDALCLHFGADGDMSEAVRAEITRLGLQEHYVLAGFTEHITDAYRLMDVFVLASREEALGSSVLDAFVYGVPAVVTRAGGLADLVAEGRGLSCPVGDADCLAQALAQVLDDAALRQQLVTRALAYVHAEHAPEVMVARTLAAYGVPADSVES